MYHNRVWSVAVVAKWLALFVSLSGEDCHAWIPASSSSFGTPKRIQTTTPTNPPSPDSPKWSLSSLSSSSSSSSESFSSTTASSNPSDPTKKNAVTPSSKDWVSQTFATNDQDDDTTPLSLSSNDKAVVGPHQVLIYDTTLRGRYPTVYTKNLQSGGGFCGKNGALHTRDDNREDVCDCVCRSAKSALSTSE